MPKTLFVSDEDFRDGVHSSIETLRHVVAGLERALSDDRSLTRGGHDPEEWGAARHDAEQRLLDVALDLITICAEAVARPAGMKLMRQVASMATETMEGRA